MRPAASQQPQEMRLTRSVGAEHRDPVAEPDLGVERLHQAGQLEVFDNDRPLTGTSAAEPHPHVLFERELLRRPGLLELGQPGLRGAVARRHPGVVRGLVLVHQHELAELLVLLVPAPAQLVESLEPLPPRLAEGRVAAAVHPHRVAGGTQLERRDPGRRLGQQLPVVADQQHRLLGAGELLLQPALAGYVQVVVRLVQQQHLVRPAEQRLQREPLLLPAGQGVHLAPLGPVVRDADCGRRTDIERHLGVVPAGVGIVGQRLGVRELHRFAVVLHQRQLEPVQVSTACWSRGGASENRRSRTVE